MLRATAILASLTAFSAESPRRYIDEGFPKPEVRASFIASTTSGRGLVVALLSRYTNMELLSPESLGPALPCAEIGLH